MEQSEPTEADVALIRRLVEREVPLPLFYTRCSTAILPVPRASGDLGLYMTVGRAYAQSWKYEFTECRMSCTRWRPSGAPVFHGLGDGAMFERSVIGL